MIKDAKIKHMDVITPGPMLDGGLASRDRQQPDYSSNLRPLATFAL